MASRFSVAHVAHAVPSGAPNVPRVTSYVPRVTSYVLRQRGVAASSFPFPMPESPIKVVFFDAAGTLFHVKGSVGDVYLRYAEKYGVPHSAAMAEKLNQAFHEAFGQSPPPLFAVDTPAKLKQVERLWWFDIVHAVFYRVGMFEGFDDYFEDVYEAFGTADVWASYPETTATLAAIKARGYELGVISNFDTRFFPILRALDLAKYFDSVTVSCTAGAVKPSPKIFHHALSHHVIDPAEALHIGDRRKEDYEGAVNAGLSAILLDRDGTSGDDAIPRITELGAVLGMLEGDVKRE